MERPPPTPARPARDTYWGVEVVDDFRYLEHVDAPEVTAWASAQAIHARRWLDRPMRPAIRSRLVELTHAPFPNYWGLCHRGGRLFAIVDRPPREQPYLAVLPSPDAPGDERAIIDPNAMDPGGDTSLDLYAPSWDGRLVAASISEKGTEDGTLHLFRVDDGVKLADVIPAVHGGTADGSVAWRLDGSGFWYTRYPLPGEGPDADRAFHQRVFHHVLGADPAADPCVLGPELPRIAEVQLLASPAGDWVLADVSLGDGGQHAYWVVRPGAAPRLLADFDDDAVEAHPGRDGLVYVVSRKGAPRGRVLRLPPLGDLSDAEVVVAEDDGAIDGIALTSGHIYVSQVVGGPMRVRCLSLDGTTVEELPLGESRGVSSVVPLEGDEAALRIQGYTEPPAWYRHRAGGPLRPTPLVRRSPARFDSVEVVREEAPAPDGTPIPVTILRWRGTPRDGRRPLRLYAYGSYGLPLTPRFDPELLPWLEQGGLYAEAHVRGGGEWGRDWHHAGWRRLKQTSIDDLAASARHLAARGYTCAERLALEGGSAGGMLVMGVLAHHPEVARAVVAHVGYGDVLRTELSDNGAFNVPEFGTVTDEAQFRALHAYSPYHRLGKGRDYPSLLALTGLNDPRVEPWQSFKMVARLQSLGGSRPVLLRASDTGHGSDTSLSDRDDEGADVLTFLMTELGMDYREPAPPSAAASVTT